MVDRPDGDLEGLFTDQTLKTAVYLRLLTIIYEQLKLKTVTTKRDLYYRDVDLFVSQTCVDEAIVQIAYSLGVERIDLNVVASPKGCVHGNLTVCSKNGKIIEINQSNGVFFFFFFGA